MKRIYHPYHLWEDHKKGFYNNCSGKEKEVKIPKVIEMFNSEKLTEEMILKVITEWKYSCEHNLSNNTMNRIAYIGQAACCEYAEIPNTVTVEAWSLLSLDVRNRSDKIALKHLNNWIKKHELCQNID